MMYMQTRRIALYLKVKNATIFSLIIEKSLLVYGQKMIWAFNGVKHFRPLLRLLLSGLRPLRVYQTVLWSKRPSNPIELYYCSYHGFGHLNLVMLVWFKARVNFCYYPSCLKKYASSKGQFHQHSTSCFYARRSQKRKKSCLT